MPDHGLRHPRGPAGERSWDEATVVDKYPLLTEKFGWDSGIDDPRSSKAVMGCNRAREARP
jgi:hypothetical protein